MAADSQAASRVFCVTAGYHPDSSRPLFVAFRMLLPGVPTAMSNVPHYFLPEWIVENPRQVEVDVCIYGGNAAGIIAAVTAVERGHSVVLLHPGTHLGGLTTGGLSYTDLGNKDAIGGASRNFYKLLGKHYGVAEEWKFEPSIATATLRSLLANAGITPVMKEFLRFAHVEDRRIKAILTLSGLQVSASQFIDATYEGDLMAKAGVSHTVGRESNAKYNEIHNGVQVHKSHQFDWHVDPFVREGDPSSGLLPEISGETLGQIGDGDNSVQAYNFRMCMTDDPAIRVPFPKPEVYDPARYALAARWLSKSGINFFAKFDRIRGGKTDTNNHGAFSTDFIGQNHAWPAADYASRETLVQKHVQYQQGLHWFMTHDAGVPDAIRTEYQRWGLAGNEFIDTGHWPHQLYIREARRMVGDYVVTEHDCLSKRICEDSVGMGAYNMDSHNCRRLVHEGRVINEGDVQVGLPRPYPISYRSIVPRRGEVENLCVPVCVSASHIAYGSVRMEPVFMILAQSGAIAASLAIKEGTSLQELPYSSLRAQLEKAGQVLYTQAVNTGHVNP